jgi:antibiotic biosynthesis monooxygenase (ABM) superfamily enzyme
MSAEATTTNNAATVIIGQKVRPGAERAFAVWQDDMNAAAARYPGFIAAETAQPTDVQPDWVVVYRFDSVAHVQAWINSSTRQEHLDKGREYFDGPATQQVITGGAAPVDPLVTVVVTHSVSPEHVDDFLEWQGRMREAESQFEGFRGTELFRPIEGLQNEWTALYRFDSAADLDAWLTSRVRQNLLDEGKRFNDFELRTIDNSFGSWFAFDQDGHRAPIPSDTKMSTAVWVGLYPTVVLLSLALSPLGMPLWLGLLIGNLLSSFVMTFFTMPYYVNKILGHWLYPSPNTPRRQTNLRGFSVIVGVMALWTVVFYLVTVVFWTLP